MEWLGIGYFEDEYLKQGDQWKFATRYHTFEGIDNKLYFGLSSHHCRCRYRKPKPVCGELLILLDFYFAAELAAAPTLHCEPNAMEREPCGFLSDADGSIKFPRAYAILVVYDHPDRRQPLIQSERRILEYCPSLQAELRAPSALQFRSCGLSRKGARMENIARPTKPRHEFVAVVVIFEVDNRFSESVSEFHVQILLGLSSIFLP